MKVLSSAEFRDRNFLCFENRGVLQKTPFICETELIKQRCQYLFNVYNKHHPLAGAHVLQTSFTRKNCDRILLLFPTKCFYCPNNSYCNLFLEDAINTYRCNILIKIKLINIVSVFMTRVSPWFSPRWCFHLHRALVML